MTGPTYSEDGHWMWNGTEWVPAPRKEQVLPQSSIDAAVISNVASETGVDPEQLTQVAPYFDQNQDQVLQQSELQQAAMSIANDPNAPAPMAPVVAQPAAMPQQPVAPMAPAAPQQPVAPMAPAVPQPAAMPQQTAAPQQPVAPMTPAVPQPAAMPQQTAAPMVAPSSGKGKMIAAISIVVVLILGSVFYIWNDNLAEEAKESPPEFLGKWTSANNDGNWIEFRSDGTVCDSDEGCSSQWVLLGGGLIEVTNDSSTTYTFDWDLEGNELTLELTSVKDVNGNEELDDSVILLMVPAQSEVVGTWTFCTNACAPNWNDTLYNVTFKNDGSLEHPGWPSPPSQETTYTIEGDRMTWNIVYNSTFSIEHSGQFEVKEDILYFAVDKIVVNSNGVTNETQTTMGGYVSINSGALLEAGRTIENFGEIIEQNKPHPQWFLDYLQFAEEQTAQDQESGDF